jgi:protein-S-isoprenylcysteine O-methyltransferase Ste14
MQPPKILPPHYFFLSLILIALVRLVEPYELDHWMTYLGVLPLVAGLAFAAFAARQFSQAGTNIVPLTESTTLVIDGMFNYTRNPMYLGMCLVLAGVALLTGSVFSWLIVLGFFALIRQKFVLREEPLMTATFGDDYAQYKGRVRRWI